MRIHPIAGGQHVAAGELIVRAYAALDPNLGSYADELRDVAGRVAAGATVLVAEEDGEVAGSVTYVPPALDAPLTEWDDPRAAGIRMLAVDAAYRGQGIGTRLVEACLDLARADGATRLVLHTVEVMRAAQRIYVRLGFQREPDLDSEVEPGFWLIGYQLALGGHPPTL